MSSVPSRLMVINLGRAGYDATFSLQRYIFDAKVQARKRHRLGQSPGSRVADPFPDVVFTVEHSDPVLTVGRRDTSDGFLRREAVALLEEPKVSKYATPQEWVAALNVREVSPKGDPNVRKLKRGGAITWHGPGQVTMYPIVAIRDAHSRFKPGMVDTSVLHWWAHTLEEAMIDMVAQTAEMLPPETDIPIARRACSGIWVGPRKLGFVGIAVDEFVSMHGCSFNVNCNLSVFDDIVMCDMPDKKPTSLAEVFQGYEGMKRASRGGWLPSEGEPTTFSTPSTREVEVDLAHHLVSRLGRFHDVTEYFTEPIEGIAALIDSVESSRVH
jgi:lipoyl(octanoyl) transferase